MRAAADLGSVQHAHPGGREAGLGGIVSPFHPLRGAPRLPFTCRFIRLLRSDLACLDSISGIQDQRPYHKLL